MTIRSQLEQSVVYERLTGILGELYAKIQQNLTIFPNQDQPFHDFSSPDGNIQGSLLTFNGEAVDKLLYANINALPINFGTMRLTVWLNATLQVPHLAFEFGTVPNLFFYIDYIPRVDLWTDLSYLQQYYEAASATHVDLRAQSDLSVFVSKSLYIRQLQSPAQICFTGPNTEASLELVRTTAHEMGDRWLGWVNQAPPVAAEHQEKLAARDLQIRRIGAERDPGNAAIAQIFGEDFTHQLVEALWK